MESFGRVVEIIVTSVLLFIVPVQYMAVREDNLNQVYVTTEAAYFVDAARNTGFITENMYQTLLKKLSATGETYQVELCHYERRVSEAENGYQEFYHGIYTEEIINGLKEDYRFGQGDFFSIKIVAPQGTAGDRFRSIFLPHTIKNRTIVIYGGAVRDEMC